MSKTYIYHQTQAVFEKGKNVLKKVALLGSLGESWLAFYGSFHVVSQWSPLPSLLCRGAQLNTVIRFWQVYLSRVILLCNVCLLTILSEFTPKAHFLVFIHRHLRLWRSFGAVNAYPYWFIISITNVPHFIQ